MKKALLICVIVMSLFFEGNELIAGSATRALIASYLFDIPLKKIDEPKIGANYNYNVWGDPSQEKDGQCLGYDDGHSGIDFQTKDVAGTATADRVFYSVSKGVVIAAGTDNYNTISIYDSSNNITVLYLHARTVNVSTGDDIDIGDQLGVQGCKGAGDAEHVHIEIQCGKKTTPACGASTTINPEIIIIGYLPPRPPQDLIIIE